MGRGFCAAWVVAVAAGCATPERSGRSTDPELSRLASVARQEFDRGQAEQAARLYLRALTMARAADDAFEIGNNAYNLAACLMSAGRHDDAAALLREARAEAARANRDPADVDLLEARNARLAGRAEEAQAIVDRLLASPSSGRVRREAGLLNAHLACDRGDVQAAAAELKASGSGDLLLAADAAGLSARIARGTNDAARAAAEYDRQADLYRRARRYRDMAGALGSAARAYGDAGAPARAADRFYRAARSLFGQGDEVGALRMIEAALPAAEQADDAVLAGRIAALFREIERMVRDRPSAKEEPPPRGRPRPVTEAR
jgi:tetratricopeptide (TPR) repeat protein